MTDCGKVNVGCGRSRGRGGRGRGMGMYVDNAGTWVPDEPAASSTPSASTSWLQTLIGGVVKTGENILTAKNQTRGILTQTSPGVFTYVQPEGSQVTLPVGTIGLPPASGSMGLVLVAGVGVLVVFMLMRGKG